MALENVEKEIDVLNAKKSSLLSEARDCGFSRKAIRELMRRRRLRRAGDVDLLEVYETALEK